jgi:hypothetical protein
MNWLRSMIWRMINREKRRPRSRLCPRPLG